MSIYGPKPIVSTKNKYIDPIERKTFWGKITSDALGEIKLLFDNMQRGTNGSILERVT